MAPAVAGSRATTEEETSVRLTAEIRYDAAPEQVFRMLCDQAFQRRKCAATGALRYEVDVVADGDGLSVSSVRELPTDTVPDFVRSFVGTSLTVRQVERWEPAGSDGSRVGTLQVQIESAPVGFTGRLRLGGGDAGSVETIDGELKASVPLVGGRIEKAAEPAIRAAIKAEQRTGTGWLAEQTR